MINSYKKLPIGKYLQIVEIVKKEQEEITEQVEIVSVLSGIPEADLLAMSIHDYKVLAQQADFLRKGPEADAVPKIPKQYKVGDFILVPAMDSKDITTAQYIDWQSWQKQGEDKMVESLSCLLIPKGCSYCDGYDIEDVQEAIRENFSVMDVVALMAFFLASWQTSVTRFLDYSKEMALKIPNKEKREEMLKEIAKLEAALRKNGDG